MDQFDNTDEDVLHYFAREVRDVYPDVLCLKETELYVDASMAHRLAGTLNFPYIFETPMSDSHVVQHSQICVAILSKYKIEDPRSYTLPYPKFDLFLPNGQPAHHFDKCIQLATINNTLIANTFHHPLEFLGHPYTDELGQQYTRELCEFYKKTLRAPLILAGDFSTLDPTVVFAEALSHLNLLDVTPPEPTKPGTEGHLDAIFADHDWKCESSAVVPTENDHYLCWADIEIG